jgi:hypothetical protein
MTEVQSIADHVIPVVGAVVESHQSQFIYSSSDCPPRLLLQVKTLAALIESTDSVTQALLENQEKIPEKMLLKILALQAECATKILRLMETSSDEASVTLPVGHRLRTNLDCHDR